MECSGEREVFVPVPFEGVPIQIEARDVFLSHTLAAVTRIHGKMGHMARVGRQISGYQMANVGEVGSLASFPSGCWCRLYQSTACLFHPSL
jgi:hypothetical protein